MAKTSNPRPRSSKAFDEKHIGREPVNGSDLTTFGPYMGALNYYNYFYGKKEAIQYLHQYLAITDKETLKKIKRVDDSRIPTTLGWLARMLERDCVLSQTAIDFFERNIKQLVERYVCEPVEKAKAETKPKERPYIADLEEQLDIFFNNGFTADFSFTEWTKANSIGPTALNEIAAFYRPLLAELEAVGKDKELKEGYRHLTAKQRKAYANFVQTFVAGAESVLENRKRVRAPRKKRQPKIENIIKGLKYQAEDKTLNIASIAPAKILGASQLLVFNTKTRKISTYISTGKFEIKGSTLLNFDEKKSTERTVRKPHEVIPKLMKANKREATKIISSLTTTASAIENGRINKNCILLAVFT